MGCPMTEGTSRSHPFTLQFSETRPMTIEIAGKPGHEDYEDCPSGTTVGYSSRGGNTTSRSEPDQCIETVNICRPSGQRNGSTRSGGLTINRNLGGDGDSCTKQIATPRPRRADPYYFDIPNDEGVKERFWFNLNH